MLQLLTGYGCFNRFSYRIGRARLFPLWTGREEDDAFRTTIRRKAFDRERDVLVRRAGEYASFGRSSLGGTSGYVGRD